MALALLVSTVTLVGCAATLAGKLVGPGGALVVSPEGRVNITSIDAADPTHASVVTEVDSAGMFSTREDLQPGIYLVEALVPGFRVSSEKVDIRKTRAVELKMVPLVAPKVSPVGANVDIDLGRGAGGAELTPPQL